MTRNSSLRVGILGAARIAPMALIGPARQVAGVEVAAVAARDERRARAFAKKHGLARVHPSYADLIADPDLEAIYNPLPNSLHCEWTVRALQAGKHVLCEKPLASNAEEAATMARVAAESERQLMEAFHYRYHPLTARMLEVVQSGALGRIEHIEAALGFPLLLPGNIRYRAELAGGATMDLGCYAIHMVRTLAQAEPEVRRAEARLFAPQVDRWMQADFAFADGRSARITCSLLSSMVLRLQVRVRGSDGEMIVSNPLAPHIFHRLRIRTHGRATAEKVPGKATYTHQLEAFVQAVRDNRPVLTDGRDAVANMRVIDAVYEAAGLRRRGH